MYFYIYTVRIYYVDVIRTFKGIKHEHFIRGTYNYLSTSIRFKNRNEMSVYLLIAAVTSFKFAPVTSVSVERLFSVFKMILSDKRHNLYVENLEKILVIYCAANYE